MSVKLLTEHHLEFLSLKGGCTGSSEFTLVKMPYCWKSHVTAQSYLWVCTDISTNRWTVMAIMFSLNSFAFWVRNFSCFSGRLLTFFQNQIFQNILSGTLSECQTVWIQIRTNIMLVLIWVQTVCKGYQQTTKSSCYNSKESIKEAK